MRRTGFSMIELMIVVSILGVLSAIAIPSMIEMQLKAKRAEAPTVLAGIGDAEVAYYATQDTWIEGTTNPGTSLTRQLRPWDPTLPGWAEIGFAPDGEVRCNYSINCQGGSSCDDGDTYVRVQATCDVDDDNNTARIYLYVDNAQATCCGGWAPGLMRYATPNEY